MNSKLRDTSSFGDSIDHDESTSTSSNHSNESHEICALHDENDNDNDNKEVNDEDRNGKIGIQSNRNASGMVDTKTSGNVSSSSTRKKKNTLHYIGRISKTIVIPDDWTVSRCRRLPEYGPRILFFSGGSALRQISECLKGYTHNSIHLITPFDSGGSSAELRKAFDMLSVGDLRNRLMALSDDSTTLGNPNTIALFSHRLSKYEPLLAQAEFRDILSGRHFLCQALSYPMRSILTSHLRWFSNRMPSDFDLCGASIGNLIITGCFLEHSRDIVTAIYLIWTLLGVKGKVRPLTGANLQIRAYYYSNNNNDDNDNGRRLESEVGQHLLGKHKIPRQIVKIDLVESSALCAPPSFASSTHDYSTTATTTASSSSSSLPAKTCRIDKVSANLVSSADVICFPMGSFFGSLLINLLPSGVGKAIVGRHCPKVYIPNTGNDPEMYGYTLKTCIEQIISMVRHDAGASVPVCDILNFILMDTKHCHYCVDISERDEISSSMGITILDMCLVENDQNNNINNDDDTNRKQHSEEGPTLKKKAHELNPRKVVEVLLTLGS